MCKVLRSAADRPACKRFLTLAPSNLSLLQEMVREEGASFDRVNVSTAVHHLGAVLHHEAATPSVIAAVDCSRYACFRSAAGEREYSFLLPA